MHSPWLHGCLSSQQVVDIILCLQRIESHYTIDIEDLKDVIVQIGGILKNAGIEILHKN